MIVHTFPTTVNVRSASNPAADLKAAFDAFQHLGRKRLDQAIVIGGILAEQKKACGHGKWLAWLKENFEYGRERAADFIRVHTERGKCGRAATFEEALQLLKQPAEEPGVNGGGAGHGTTGCAPPPPTLTDADFHAPELWRSLTPDTPPALRSVLARGVPFEGAVADSQGEPNYLVMVARPRDETPGDEGKYWHVCVMSCRHAEKTATKRAVAVWAVEDQIRRCVAHYEGTSEGGIDKPYTLLADWSNSADYEWACDNHPFIDRPKFRPDMTDEELAEHCRLWD